MIDAGSIGAPVLAALVGAGLVAGALNTLAGGGSLLLVPALMLTGLSATVANGTSRVAVLAQCAASVTSFARKGRLPWRAARSAVPPVLVGAAVGAAIATQVSNRVFEPLLLVTLAVMALALLVSPARFMAPPGATPRAPTTWWAVLALFAAGIYGGVLQAGAGLVFLAIFAGGLRYDLVEANALKGLVMLLYITGTVGVFATAHEIMWVPA
ncbi:MAG TPA: sulfite exporter TauE/SafE family protein, partial [Kofleriaceae bacterium]|nr:sulfite exporter TauE/SafE family protein [Kofleriaceae bacterium]